MKTREELTLELERACSEAKYWKDECLAAFDDHVEIFPEYGHQNNIQILKRDNCTYDIYDFITGKVFYGGKWIRPTEETPSYSDIETAMDFLESAMDNRLT